MANVRREVLIETSSVETVKAMYDISLKNLVVLTVSVPRQMYSYLVTTSPSTTYI